MRIFGSENISKFMDRLGMEEDDPIEHSMITRSIEKESVGHIIYKHLMNGVSHMLVFVVAGGLGVCGHCRTAG